MNGPSEFYNLKGTYNINDDQKIDIFYEKINEHLTNQTATTRINYENRRDSFGAAYRGKTDKSDYEIRAYYNQNKKDQPRITLATGAYSDFDDFKYSTWVIEGKDSLQLDERNLLTFGGEYRSAAYRGTRVGGGGDTITKYGLTKAIGEHELKYQALYIQDELMLSGKFLLVPAIRYDHSDKFGSNVSPKLGLTYKLTENYRLKASYGRGFKAPTISELYMEMHGMPGVPAAGIHVYGNPDLKPEKSTNWEISFEGEQNDNFGKITYFNNKVTNLITSYQTGSMTGPPSSWNVTSRYINVNRAQINGLEVEIGRNLNKSLTVKTTLAYLDALDKTDNSRLAGRPRNNTTLQLLYDDAPHGWSAILWNNWTHDYHYVTTNATNDYSYSTLNFTVNKKWKNGTYSAWFAVENITDKKIPTIYMYEGRIWRLGFTIGF
jgi:outer membrane receptor for ferrienterochelin and colicins